MNSGREYDGHDVLHHVLLTEHMGFVVLCEIDLESVARCKREPGHSQSLEMGQFLTTQQHALAVGMFQANLLEQFTEIVRIVEQTVRRLHEN